MVNVECGITVVNLIKRRKPFYFEIAIYSVIIQLLYSFTCQIMDNLINESTLHILHICTNMIILTSCSSDCDAQEGYVDAVVLSDPKGPNLQKALVPCH